jgi:hypothetical protein
MMGERARIRLPAMFMLMALLTALAGLIGPPPSRGWGRLGKSGPLPNVIPGGLVV